MPLAPCSLRQGSRGAYTRGTTFSDRSTTSTNAASPRGSSSVLQASASSLSNGSTTDTSRCPISKLSRLSDAVQQHARSYAGGYPAVLGEDVPIPGPSPFSLDSLKAVSSIFSEGLHEAMLRFSLKYGDICRFSNPSALNGASSWVFINSPDLVQHVCATNVKNYSRRYLPDIYKFVTHEKGILGSQGSYNARHRRLCSPPFRSKAQLQRFSSTVVQQSLKLVDIWTRHGAHVTDVAQQTQRLTLDVVGMVAFSHDFRQTDLVSRDLGCTASEAPEKADSEAPEKADMLWAINTFGEILADIFITPLPILQVLDRIGFPHLSTLRKSVDTIRDSMLSVIQARRLAHDKLRLGGVSGDSGIAAAEQPVGDLLDALLLSLDDDGRLMTDEELWEDVHDILGAGHETTATTVAAAVYCISVHPDVEARVAKELDEVLGGRPPQFSDLEQLRYLSQCVKEVLRLYPAIPIFPREAQDDDTFPSGQRVHAGDVVFMSSYALGRSPAIWEEPLQFRPERFDPASEAALHRFQWLPFGAGPRMCLGASFAQMSVTLMAATLVQHLRFTPITPSSKLIPVKYDITMNFGSTKGLLMKVEPRHA